MISILDNIVIKNENIKKNLEMTLGLCLTERVMLELVEKGIGRQGAHQIMRKLANKCWDEKLSLKQAMLEDLKIRELVTDDELDRWLEPGNYIGTAVEQVERLIQELQKYVV